QEKIQRAIKASVRKSEKDDTELDTKLANTVTDFDAAMTVLKVALDRKISTRINVSEKRNDSKMDALREHNLLMAKDIEALKKFEGDLQGLEGKLQTIVSNLTQARLDMEKLAQRVKSEMTRTKATVDDELGKVTNDVNTKLLEFASDLKQADERNLGIIRLELKKNQTAVNKQLQGMAVDMSSFENDMNAKIRSGQAAIKKELTTFGSDVDKRLRMLEASIGANTKNQKELERIFNGKTEDMIRHDSAIDERIDRVEAGLMDHMENFKDITKRRELMTKNEMARIRKSVDQKVGHAALELERKIGLLGKDVENLKSIESEIGGIAEELRKRKEESAAISAKIGAISQEITDKSEKDDMKIKEQLDMMQSDMMTSLGTAESRTVKYHAGLLSTVRQTLKKDIQSLKEHHAAMKTEIKNLRGLGSAVNDIQQAVTATQKKVDDTVNNV
ncbi:MAG: hypothetical protein KAT35_00905, partial [Candidatus Aenigmarchaeota archaeon]|nr:hypothetical protein [Candidatus Aenigmarchaeota archaeon]